MRELERDPPATASTLPRNDALAGLAIVGAGRVGRAIQGAADRNGIAVRLAGREDTLEICRGAAAILLCVPDREIADVAEQLADAVSSPRFAGHTSGATDLDALSPLAERGAQTFSLHPLQTVPDGSTDLTGAPCAVSGLNDEAGSFATELAKRLGMKPFRVLEERRAAYHAAASIASNFLVALEESAAELLAAAGIDNPHELLAPLVLRSAANWAADGATALTGPIARGDAETVERHREALGETAPELLPLYEALAKRTRAIAERQEER